MLSWVDSITDGKNRPEAIERIWLAYEGNKTLLSMLVVYAQVFMYCN